MSAPRVELRLTTSRSLLQASFWMHAGGAFVVLMTQLPLPVASLVCLALLASHRRIARVERGLEGDRVTALALDRAGAWQVETRLRTATSARLRPAPLVLPGVTVLDFVLADGRRRAAIVLADNCDETQFRLLRIRLRSR